MSRVWAWPRPQNCFRVVLANRDMDSLWKTHFRVTRPTFNTLCDLLRRDLQKQHTRMRSPVSVEARVAAGCAVEASNKGQLQKLWTAIWNWDVYR